MDAALGSIGNPAVPDNNPHRPRPMSWQAYADELRSKWFALLATEPEENDVQAFLELHPALVPGGSGDIGPGGHHGSDLGAMFRQPRLKGAGRDFGPDFMWVTRSSSLITPILIEIEKPSKRWFGADGRPTKNFADAHDQLRDWRDWFTREGNSAIFRDQYMILGDRQPVRSLEPQFVLIYGRQFEFELGGGHKDPDSLNLKRSKLRGPDETLLTFDSLRPRYDHSSSITVTMKASGPEAFAFSPVYCTGPHLLDGINRLSGVDAALDRSVMLSEERREYLRQRWMFWGERSAQEQRSSRKWAHQLGRE